MDGEIIRNALRCSARLNALLGRDLRSRDSLPLEARSTTLLVTEDNGGRASREKGLNQHRLYRS